MTAHWLLPLPAVLLLAAITAPCPAAGTPVERSLDEVRGDIAALCDSLNAARGQMDQEQRAIEEAERAIARLVADLRRQEADISRLRFRLDELQARRSALDDDIVTQREWLARQVRSAYLMGRESVLKLLLNQDSATVASRMFAYYGFLNRARQVQIDRLAADLAQLAATDREIVRRHAEADALRARGLAERQRLEQRQADRRDLLENLTRRIESDDARLKALNADEHRLVQLIESIAAMELAKARGSRRFRDARGHLPWPVEGALEARFGAPRGVGALAWDGVVIDAAEGAAVHAVAPGRVVFADWLRGFGLLLILDHGEGYMSLYGRNRGLFKEIGDWVEAGDVIADVGGSGGQSRAGLYFGIRQNGKPINPQAWCRAPGRQGEHAWAG